jgi:hypothetical protein
MMRKLFLVLAAWAAMLTATSMRRILQVPAGPDAGAYGRVVCCDSDHDSLPEMMFLTGTIQPDNPYRLEVWEHQGWNRFSLVSADTGNLPGTTIASPIPFAAGDIDGDGLTDIVCIGIGRDSIDSTAYDVMMTLESPDSFSYPCSLSWYYRFSDLFVIPIPIYYPPDLDNDGHDEILCVVPSLSLGMSIWENAGDDQNSLVWRDTIHDGYRFTFGDFDNDGRMNLATATLSSSGILSVWECAGDNRYEVVYQDTVWQPNGADVFTTNDVDGDGKPEFYVAYENVPRGKMYLYMWEADHAGTDAYRRTLIDSVSFSGTDWGRISECGDIDGDGIDECIWTTPDVIKVYKAVGDNDLEEVWHWNNDHGGFRSLVSTVYDINNDGYNELITAGNAKTSIFEIDAVDLLSPNGGSCSVGDTVSIRWVTNTPPRCDSLSLFLRRGITPSPLPPPQGGGNEREGELTDSLWNLDTIATGIPGTDTIYRWVVPSGVPDTGRIVVMAYGPGHQYDISDSAIRFTGSGVAEASRNLFVTRLRGCSPSPFARGTSVNYELAHYGPVELTVHDVSGRLVQRLESGPRQRGFHAVRWDGADSRGRVVPAGVYFVRFSAGGKVSTGRVTLVR